MYVLYRDLKMLITCLKIKNLLCYMFVEWIQHMWYPPISQFTLA